LVSANKQIKNNKKEGKKQKIFQPDSCNKIISLKFKDLEIIKIGIIVKSIVTS